MKDASQLHRLPRVKELSQFFLLGSYIAGHAGLLKWQERQKRKEWRMQKMILKQKKLVQIRGGGGSLEHLTPGGDREPAFQSRVSLGMGGGRSEGT